MLNNYSDKIDKYSQIKILINLAEINKQTRSFEKAYTYFGEAEKLAKQFEMTDLLIDIYFREGAFLSENYKNLDLPPNSAEKHFMEGDKIVSEFPLLWNDNLLKISSYYREYAFYLADKNYAEKSFLAMEYSKKLLILKTILDQGYDSGESELVKRYQSDYYKFKNNAKTISDKRIDGLNDASVQKFKENNREIISTQLQSFNNSKISGLINTKKTPGNLKYTVLTSDYKNNKIYFYKVHGNKYEVSVSKLNNETSISDQIIKIFSEKISKEQKPTILLNEFLINNFFFDSSIKADSFYNTAFLFDFIKEKNENIFSNLISILEKPVNSFSENELEVIRASSLICDNETPVIQFSNMLQTNVISPDMIIKKIPTNTMYQDLLYFAYSISYSDIDGVLLFYSNDKIPVKENAPAFLQNENKLINMNTYVEKNGKYINLGNTGKLTIKVENGDNDVYFKQMNLKLKEKDFIQAKTFLQKWITEKPEKIYGEFEYYNSLFSQMQGEYLKADEALKNIKYIDIVDAELQKKVISLQIYLKLNLVDYGSAEKILSETEKYELPEKVFYKNLIGLIKNYKSFDEIELNTVMDRNHLILLNVKYLHAIKGIKAATEKLQKEKTFSIDNLTEYDQQYISILLNKGDSLKIKNSDLQNYYFEKDYNKMKEWALGTGSFDMRNVVKIIKLKREVEKEKDYVYFENIIKSIEFTNEINSNILEYTIFLSEIFRIANEYYNEKIIEDLYSKISKNKLINNSYIMPCLSDLIIEKTITNNNDFTKLIIKENEKLISNESQIFSHMEEMKIVVAVKENNFVEVSKLISKKNENSFPLKGFYIFCKIFSDLKDVKDNTEKLTETEDFFFNNIEFLNNKSFTQKYIAVKIIENLISANNENENYSRALMFSSLKKQIEYHYDNNFKLTVIPKSDEAEYFKKIQTNRNYFYETVVNQNISENAFKKLKDKTVIMSFEKLDNDIIVYKITSEKIEYLKLENKVPDILRINTMYLELLKKQEDTFIVSKELNNLFSEILEQFETFDTIYIVHDNYLKNIPFELLKTKTDSLDAYRLFYLSSLNNVMFQPGTIKVDFKLISDNNSFETNLTEIALKESGLKHDENSQNAYYLKSIKYNKFQKFFEGSFLMEIQNLKFLEINEIDDSLSENQLADICHYIGTDYILLISPYVRDINIAYFNNKFYENFAKTGNIRNSFSFAINAVRSNMKYKNAANWEKIRLYVAGI